MSSMARDGRSKVLRSTQHVIGHFGDVRRCSQPISWHGTEKPKPTKLTNNTKPKCSELTQKHTKIQIKPLKHTNTKLALTKHKFKNCSYLCAYRCAQLSYTTQRRAVLIIFPLYLQTTTIAQILSIGGEMGHG